MAKDLTVSKTHVPGKLKTGPRVRVEGPVKLEGFAGKLDMPWASAEEVTPSGADSLAESAS